MSKHVSADDLASYAAGELRPRKAARAASHLAGCPECSEQMHAVQQVPSLLASAQFPPIPDHLSSRIEMAIAGESAARVASEPASEAGRRDLQVGGGQARQRRRMHRPSSSLGIRLAAGAAAAVIVAGGSYELATRTPSTTTSAGQAVTGSASLAPNMTPAQLKFGPSLQYKHAGHNESIQLAQATTNFQPGTFRTQTEAAMQSEQVNRGNAAVEPSSGGVNGGKTVNSSARPAPSGAPGFVVPNLARVRACVGLIAAGRGLLLVELAKFKGVSAMIILVGPTSTSPAFGYAVGPSCSSSDKGILFSLALPGL